MSGSKHDEPVILWDSCVFLAWLKEEKDKPLDDIREFIKDFEAGKKALQISVLSYAEVLDIVKPNEPLAATAGTRFRQWVKRPSVEVLDVDPRIADKAGELKEKTIALRATVPKAVLKIPDALIAATAMIYEADILHTFDPDMLNVAPHGIFGTLSVTMPAYPWPDTPLFKKPGSSLGDGLD